MSNPPKVSWHHFKFKVCVQTANFSEEEKMLFFSVNSFASLALRDAPLRISSSSGALHSNRHHGIHPQPDASDCHPKFEQAQAWPTKCVHPHPRHLRLLPLQLHFSADSVVNPRGPLALRIKHWGSLSSGESRPELPGHHVIILHRGHRVRPVQIHHAASETPDDS